MTGDEVAEQIDRLCARDPRYRREAYYFVIAALEAEMVRLGERRHLTGQELTHAVRRLALENYGLMARSVLETWGCRSTDDFGAIVYNLIAASLFTRTSDDRIEDFHAVYDFGEAFDSDYEPGAGKHESS